MLRWSPDAVTYFDYTTTTADVQLCATSGYELREPQRKSNMNLIFQPRMQTDTHGLHLTRATGKQPLMVPATFQCTSQMPPRVVASGERLAIMARRDDGVGSGAEYLPSAYCSARRVVLQEEEVSGQLLIALFRNLTGSATSGVGGYERHGAGSDGKYRHRSNHRELSTAQTTERRWSGESAAGEPVSIYQQPLLQPISGTRKAAAEVALTADTPEKNSSQRTDGPDQVHVVSTSPLMAAIRVG